VILHPRHAALTLAALLIASTGAPAELGLALTPEGTRLAFLLHASGHDVHGTLELREGTLHFDPTTATAAGRIVIDATSAETGNARRDRKMHGAVLESAKYPDFVFIPRTVVGTLAPEGASHVDLAGTLSIHGAEHDVTVPAEVRRDGAAVHATARIEIPYVAWGMKDPSILFAKVAKTVEVTIEVKAPLME
jgi:polyisoprenoid-binding protein YceI